MALMLVSAFSLFYVAKANPSFFMRAQTGTPDLTASAAGGAYQVPGTATTTLVLDTGAGTAGSTDSAVLLVQYAASSTNGILNIDIQYSQDGTTYYADTPNATSSPTQTLANVQVVTFPFASSTINRGNPTNANGATSTRKVIVPTPTRYVRAVFYSSVGTNANGTFWAEFVAKRQAGN